MVQDASPRRRGVVVGIDGRPGTRDVLGGAATEAELQGTWLRVLHVWEPDTALRAPDHGDPDRQEWLAVDDEVRALVAARPRLQVELVATVGTAVDLLVGASETAALVVVGAGRVPGAPAGDRPAGRRAHRLLQRALGPVLVVPTSRDPRAGQPSRSPAPTGPAG